MDEKLTAVGISITAKELHTLGDTIKSRFPQMRDDDPIYIICDSSPSIHDHLKAGHSVGYQTFHKGPVLSIPFVSTGFFEKCRKKP
jgi:hypothetical protein